MQNVLQRCLVFVLIISNIKNIVLVPRTLDEYCIKTQPQPDHVDDDMDDYWDPYDDMDDDDSDDFEDD